MAYLSLHRQYIMTPCKGAWEAIAARKRDIQGQAIQDFLQSHSAGVETDQQGPICDLDYIELRYALARGDLKAETVIVAYIHRYGCSLHSELCIDLFVQSNRSA